MVWHRNAVRIYRFLLLGYPAEFRNEYGEEMETLFAARMKAESSFRLWPEVLADVVTTVPKEHLSIIAADLRYCLRVLGKSPGFVFAALLAIILGLCATTTVFSLINAVVIRSLPYDHPEHLVYMWAPAPNVTGIPRETPPGRQFVAVISDNLWQSRFGRAPDAVGKSLRIGTQSYRIVGVMRKEFSYPHGIDFPVSTNWRG